MSANAGSWLSAHGKLWYDDRWYRLAWIVWPQALGLLLVTLWLYPPSAQGFIPWAKPVTEAPKNQPAFFLHNTVRPRCDFERRGIRCRE